MQKPTRHFSWHELGDPPAEHRDRAHDLAHHLERLRILKSDRPLHLVSAYRSPARNRSVGGANASRHLKGDAADLPYGYCRTADAVAAGFVGIGSRDGYAVHVDVRDGPPVRWTY